MIHQIGEIVIRVASENDCLEILTLILENGRVDPGNGGTNEAIMCAAEKGNAAIVELLLKDDNVNPGVEDNTPI